MADQTAEIFQRTGLAVEHVASVFEGFSASLLDADEAARNFAANLKPYHDQQEKALANYRENLSAIGIEVEIESRNAIDYWSLDD